MFYFTFLMGMFFSFFCKNKRKVLIGFTILLALISFFRYGIGADYFAYEFLYYRLNESFIAEIKNGLDPQEVGFRILGSLFRSLDLPYQFYISIIAIINLLFIYKLSVRYSGNPMLSMFLYFSMFYLVWTLSGLRQGITIAIGLYYLLKSIEENNTLRIIVVSILLSFIHTSAVILIVLYYLSKIEFRRKDWITLIIASLIFSVLPLGFLFNYIPNSSITENVTPYLQTNMSLNYPGFQGISRLAILTIFLIYYESLIKLNSFNKNILNVYIMSIIIYFVFQFMGELTASRFSIYGKVLEVILFSNIYSMYKQRVNKLIFISFLCLFSLFYFHKDMNAMEEQSGLISNNKLITPYTNIYNKNNFTFNTRYYKLAKENDGK